MRLLVLLLLSTFLASCARDERAYFTAEIVSTCTAIDRLDTLRTVLFTNSNRDFGGESGWLAPLLNPKRRFVRNLVKKDGRFYVDSVLKAEYLRVYVTGYADRDYCTGHKTFNDFRSVQQDTFAISLCIQPVARSVESVTY